MYFSVMSDEPIIQDLSDETSINTFQTSNSTSSEIESDEDVKEREYQENEKIDPSYESNDQKFKKLEQNPQFVSIIKTRSQAKKERELKIQHKKQNVKNLKKSEA